MNINTKQQNFISTQAYKGARDFYPKEMGIRNYIFNTCRAICKRYGFEEYDFPILEPFETFAAKSGEEIVNNQLYSFEDKSGRKVAVRPELTPGTARMIAKRYNEIEKPIKWFMIGNNWRYEKPQKGRGREFYQLEMNIFGIKGAEADFEIFSAAIDIMKELGADESKFCVKFSDRRLISALLRDVLKLDEVKQIEVRRLMDKWLKMEKAAFQVALAEIGLEKSQCKTIEDFMNSNEESLSDVIPENILKQNEGYLRMQDLITLLKDADLWQFCRFDPSIIRGFDYSDGLVYEIFDLNPDNSRSLFGGERFDKLINIFGDFTLPATGFAMGDYTLLEFLKGWNLLPELTTETKVLVTVFDTNTKKYSYKIAKELREAGINTDLYLIQDKLDKQLKYANKKGIRYVIILGPNEIEKNKIVLKDMKLKKQSEISLKEALSLLKKA